MKKSVFVRYRDALASAGSLPPDYEGHLSEAQIAAAEKILAQPVKTFRITGFEGHLDDIVREIKD
jgi:hypothetical protein